MGKLGALKLRWGAGRFFARGALPLVGLASAFGVLVGRPLAEQVCIAPAFEPFKFTGLFFLSSRQ